MNCFFEKFDIIRTLYINLFQLYLYGISDSLRRSSLHLIPQFA